MKLNTIYLKLFVICVIGISLVSCKSVNRVVGDSEVFLYKGQGSFMDGNYFIKPYDHYGKYKSLVDIFELNEGKDIQLVKFSFDDDKLEIFYSNGLKEYKKVVNGKMKNGAFRYVNKTSPVGIPLILFNYQRHIHHIALGNDDNIIITEYSYNYFHFLLMKMSENKVENKYYYDRQLKL